MKFMPFVAMVAIGLVPSPLFAQSLYFFGEIGNAPVFVSLDRAGDKLTGSDLYLKKAKELRLEGTINADGFAIDEFSFVNGEKTGGFKGQPGAAVWSGTWQ